LNRQDIAEWLQAEQVGFFSGQSVPEYRKITTTLALETNGPVPAGFGFTQNGRIDLPHYDLTDRVHVRDSINDVLEWIKGLGSHNAIYFPIPEGDEYSRAIRKVIRVNPRFAHQVTFLLRLNELQIKAIPEHIKDKVLDWACALET